jgi:hypothetical protein
MRPDDWRRADLDSFSERGLGGPDAEPSIGMVRLGRLSSANCRTR